MMKRFTGWHMATILIAFFGVVVSVNVVMARLAVGTFGGTVVANSYVASQEFNGWLHKARAQEALGWQAKASLDADRHVLVEARDAASSPLDGVRISLTAAHPLGRIPPVALSFAAQGRGTYRSVESLPEGRWQGRLELYHAGKSFRSMEQFQ